MTKKEKCVIPASPFVIPAKAGIYYIAVVGYPWLHNFWDKVFVCQKAIFYKKIIIL